MAGSIFDSGCKDKPQPRIDPKLKPILPIPVPRGFVFDHTQYRDHQLAQDYSFSGAPDPDVFCSGEDEGKTVMITDPDSLKFKDLGRMWWCGTDDEVENHSDTLFPDPPIDPQQYCENLHGEPVYDVAEYELKVRPQSQYGIETNVGEFLLSEGLNLVVDGILGLTKEATSSPTSPTEVRTSHKGYEWKCELALKDEFR